MHQNQQQQMQQILEEQIKTQNMIAGLFAFVQSKAIEITDSSRIVGKTSEAEHARRCDQAFRIGKSCANKQVEGN